MSWFRITLGEARPWPKKTKWHHFVVEAAGFAEAAGRAGDAFSASVGGAPVPFLCIRFGEGRKADAVWKYSGREWTEVPLAEYEAEQASFRESLAERRRAREDSARSADAVFERRSAQVAELRDAARAVLAGGDSACAGRLAAAIDATDWVGGGGAASMDQMIV